MAIVSARLTAEYRISYLDLLDYLATLAFNHCSSVVKQIATAVDDQLFITSPSVFNCYPCNLIGITEIKLACYLTKMVLGLEVGRAVLKEKTPLWVCSENTSVSEPCIQTLTMVRRLLYTMKPCFLV